MPTLPACAPPPPAPLPPFQSYLRLESIDPETNRARFYAVTIQPTFWNDLALVCGWGRIGTQGRLRTVHCSDAAQAHTALRPILQRRLRHGYRLVDWL